MPELESPTCTIDLRDPSNCLNIAMAKPGEAIRVIVRTATATRSDTDGSHRDAQQ